MTTDELNLTEVSWGDHRIRLIELDGGQYVPVGDIAKVTGVRKRAYHNLMDKNPDVFRDHERGVQLSSPGGSQETRCIDLVGANTLLARISINHIKNPETKATLIAFNEWMMQRAAGKTVPALPALKEPDFDLVLRKLKFVRSVHEETGWDLTDMQKRVLEDAGFYSLTHAADIKPALPAPVPEKKFKGFYTATDIGELCGKSGQEINQWLYNNGYIIKDPEGEWHLTDVGKEFAYEHQYCPPNTLILRNRIEWKPEILDKMNIKPVSV